MAHMSLFLQEKKLYVFDGVIITWFLIHLFSYGEKKLSSVGLVNTNFDIENKKHI